MYRGQLEYLLRFQSTLPRRERQHPPFCKSKRGSISIHAPAKGATIFKIIKNTDCFYFNPRSREGSDRGRQRLSIKLYNFNPRSREGSDGGFNRRDGGLSYFNPRSREGSDASKTLPLYTAQAHFNPRSREGSDLNMMLLQKKRRIFQSTLPRRERLCSHILLTDKYLFQSTLPRRERRVS